MRNIYTFVFLFLSIFMPAQNTIKINPFGEDELPEKFKINSTVKFKISHVNTFKINGDLASKPININFEVAPIFSNLFKEKEEEKAPKNENTNNKYDYILGEKFALFNKNKNEINSITLKVFDSLKKHNQELETKFLDQYQLFIKKYNSIQQQVVFEDKLIKLLSDSIFIEDTLGLKASAKNYYKSSFKYHDAQVFNETKNSLDTLSICFTKMVKIFDELNKTLEKDSIQITGMLKSKDEKAYLKVLNAYMYQNRKKYFADEMAFVIKSMEAFLDVKNRNTVIEKAQAGLTLYSKILRAKFEIFTDAEQITDDEMELTPKLKNAKGKVVHSFKPLKIISYGGWKVNFSTGYFLSFIGDDQYGWVKDSGGSTIGIIATNKDKITHALGGLMHVYSRWQHGPQVGMSFGLSLSTNQNLGFYAGPSVFFLEKNRLVVTTGCSLIKVKQLNEANVTNVNGAYLFNSSTDTEIKYDSVYKGAFFVGVSYNLTK